MLSVIAPHGREMSQDLREKIISLHKKGEGYKKISKKPNRGDYFPWHNTAYTAEEWHAWVPSTKEASPKAQAQKSPPRVCLGPCWQRWRLLGLYTLEWWDQDKCFWNWWLQNCMVSQRWGIQRKMHGAYSETWWWQCPYVGLHECCWCRGAAFHWWHHSVPLVVVHFSNMTMILNTHLRPLLDFWRRTGWKWFSGQVCLLIWAQSNTYG